MIKLLITVLLAATISGCGTESESVPKYKVVDEYSSSVNSTVCVGGELELQPSTELSITVWLSHKTESGYTQKFTTSVKSFDTVINKEWETCNLYIWPKNFKYSVYYN